MFFFAELQQVCQTGISMFYYVCVYARMSLCLCVCVFYVFPVVQTWVLNVTDKLASMLVCVGQDVPLQQMHSGLVVCV